MEKVKFVTIYKGAIFEDTGINRIIAYLNEHGIGAKSDYIHSDLKVNDEMLQRFEGYQYVGFSVYDSNFNYIKELTKSIKEIWKNIIIFYGSQFVTISYDYILKADPYVDFLVLGDGEITICEFLSQHKTKRMDEILNDSQHLISREFNENKFPEFTDIQLIPWPKHNKKIMNKHLYTSLKTSNGCLGDCGFCGYVRRKWSGYSADIIAKEVVRIQKEHNIRSIMFADNSFEDPGKEGKIRISAFLEQLRQGHEKYSFFANIRAESFKRNTEDIRLLKEMRKGGFTQLFIGVESGNEDDLKLYNKKASIIDNSEIIHLLRENDIEPKWGFIMLNPYSTKQRMRKNYEFLINHKSHTLFHFMSYLMIFHNSKLYYKAKQDGLINEIEGQQIQYVYKDAYAKNVYQFIKNEYENTNFQYIARNMKDALLTYYQLAPLTNMAHTKIEEIKRHIAKDNEWFFSLIYDEFNIFKAKEHFEEYKKQIKSHAQEINRLKMAAIREYIRLYN